VRIDYSDFGDPSPEAQARRDHQRELRLNQRAAIRADNHLRPRCAGCGADMPVHMDDDTVTQEQLDQEGYSYLLTSDFRPGDLVCFWCISDMTDIGEYFQSGRA
jgi:hypothetical protein